MLHVLWRVLLCRGIPQWDKMLQLLYLGRGIKSRLGHSVFLGLFERTNQQNPLLGLELTTLRILLSLLTHWAICSETTYLHEGFSLFLFDDRHRSLKFERGSNTHHEKLQWIPKYQFRSVSLLGVQLQNYESHILSTPVSKRVSPDQNILVQNVMRWNRCF